MSLPPLHLYRTFHQPLLSWLSANFIYVTSRDERQAASGYYKIVPETLMGPLNTTEPWRRSRINQRCVSTIGPTQETFVLAIRPRTFLEARTLKILSQKQAEVKRRTYAPSKKSIFQQCLDETNRRRLISNRRERLPTRGSP